MFVDLLTRITGNALVTDQGPNSLVTRQHMQCGLQTGSELLSMIFRAWLRNVTKRGIAERGRKAAGEGSTRGAP